MDTKHSSVTVDRPIHDVFAFLADPTNVPLWRAEVTLAAHTGDAGNSTTAGRNYLLKVTNRNGALCDELYQITRCVPPNLVEFVSTRAAVHTEGRFSLAALDPSTTHVEFSLRRTSREFRASVRRAHRTELSDHVQCIENLPTAMDVPAY